MKYATTLYIIIIVIVTVLKEKTKRKKKINTYIYCIFHFILRKRPALLRFSSKCSSKSYLCFPSSFRQKCNEVKAQKNTQPTYNNNNNNKIHALKKNLYKSDIIS